MSEIQKVDELLTKAQEFYLATVDGDKPKVRPLGFHLLYEDKIYFGVGTFKEVYKQLEANQNVEIAAWDGEHFLRYYGTADLSGNDAVVENMDDELKNDPAIVPSKEDTDNCEICVQPDEEINQLYSEYWKEIKSN